MTNRIKASFDNIRAEDKLKSDTTLYLKKEIARRKKRTAFKRYVPAFASAIILFMSGIITYNIYFTPVAYVDVDVNPSFELTLNSFDRVISSNAYNDDGSELISSLSLAHKSYGEALVILMESMAEQGYFQEEGLVSATLQTDDRKKENVLLANIQTGIEGYLTESHHAAQVDVFPVSNDTRVDSHEQGVSPAKYLAILELIEVDPTASVESCKGHSISEIKQLARNHGNHNNNDDGADSEPPADEDSPDDEDTAPQHQEQDGNHHEEKKGGGHRRNGH